MAQRKNSGGGPSDPPEDPADDPSGFESAANEKTDPGIGDDEATGRHEPLAPEEFDVGRDQTWSGMDPGGRGGPERRDTDPGLEAAGDTEEAFGQEAFSQEAFNSVREDTDPGIATPAGTQIGSSHDNIPDDGGQVIDFSSGRADGGLTADDDAPAPTEAGLGEGDELDEVGARVAVEDLEPLIEALLFASDKPVNMADLKRLTGETDTRLLNGALDALVARRKESGIQVMSAAGAYTLRTNPRFGDWVSKLVAGKPVRLSRAMLETLAIVAYRQPITRPEIDDIRGVDCGPVLKTLLDRNLVRIIGKKEEVGRPMLYGTTAEFLRIFSLKDLTQLPTLRQFHELSAEHQAKVDESHPAAVEAATGLAQGGPGGPIEPLATPAVTPDPDEDDRLINELEEASEAASRAAGPLAPEPPPPADTAPDRQGE